MPNKLEKVKCDFCNSNDFNLFAEQKDLIHKVDSKVFQVVSCNKCGLKFTNPRPTKETISFYYSNKYSFHSNKSKLVIYLKEIFLRVSNSIFIRKLSFLFPRKINRFLIKSLKPKIKDPVLYTTSSGKNVKEI